MSGTRFDEFRQELEQSLAYLYSKVASNIFDIVSNGRLDTPESQKEIARYNTLLPQLRSFGKSLKDNLETLENAIASLEKEPGLIACLDAGEKSTQAEQMPSLPLFLSQATPSNSHSLPEVSSPNLAVTTTPANSDPLKYHSRVERSDKDSSKSLRKGGTYLAMTPFLKQMGYSLKEAIQIGSLIGEKILDDPVLKEHSRIGRGGHLVYELRPKTKEVVREYIKNKNAEPIERERHAENNLPEKNRKTLVENKPFQECQEPSVLEHLENQKFSQYQKPLYSDGQVPYNIIKISERTGIPEVFVIQNKGVLDIQNTRGGEETYNPENLISLAALWNGPVGKAYKRLNQ